jgi:DNA-binding transcriptional ArsR family regulator
VNEEADVFKALADPTRRDILDALFERDGQTLSSIEARFAMTRFGVMRHLAVLEDAGLVVTRKSGREKLHFLNAVPVRDIYERWVSKYTGATASALLELKRHMEKPEMEKTMEKVYEIYIRTTPERLWEALVDPEIRSKYTYGAVFTGEVEPGVPYEMSNPNWGGMAVGEGETLEVDPPRRLAQSMRVLLNDATKAEGFSRLTWEIEQVGDSCKLTLVHDQMRDGADEHLYGGWPMTLSSIKTWLESGTILTTPGNLDQYNEGRIA